MLPETIKHLGAAALIAAVVLGFAAFSIRHRAQRQALCPGYSAYQACIAMGE